MKILVILLSFLTLIACQQESAEPLEQNASQPSIIQLNDQNIEEFSLIFAEQYQLMLDELIHGFNEAKEQNDSHLFVSYRNFYWTPKYIERKDYYQAVRERNSLYLVSSPADSLFDHFEKLIYIGIDLKHGLNKKDDALLRKTFAAIDKATQDIKTTLARIAKT
jgi:hypothetical protein